MSTHEPELTKNLERFLRRYYREAIGELAQRYPNEQRALEIDYNDVLTFDVDLADDLLERPKPIIEHLEIALANYDLPVDVDLDDARIRVTNVDGSRQFSVGEYRARHREQLLAVTGQITKTTKVRPQLLEAAFECQRCGTLQYIPQAGDELQEPYECRGCEKKGPWSIDRDRSTYRDYQLVRLQEPPEETQGGDGRFIDVSVHEDLVEAVQPGDRATVVSTLEFSEQRESRVSDIYLRAYGVEVQETDFEEIDTDEYRDEIDEIAAADDPIELVANSIAPKHRGDDRIKEAVALQLFGGTRVVYPDGMADRGNIHVLLLGDPGTGKSTVLNAVANIAPRSVKASGKGASMAGMTAAAVRDDFGETEWTLEAGALVLANKGIACVDEIDKVGEEVVSSLHGALEDEVVHISKAGINATLPAQTSLLAAGNPKYGRFDRHEPIAEQIELDPALMSRFDLMFMVSDDIDETREREVTRHMVESRRTPSSVEPAVDEAALRAYVAHAKQTVHPRIQDDGVVGRLTDFFTGIRLMNQGDADAAVPVTRRKLEGIQRLAEASARARLSEEVTREDLERAIGLVTDSMRQVGFDPEARTFDADLIETGTSKAQRDRIKTVLDIIQELETATEPAELEDIEREAREGGLTPGRVQHTITKLRQRGEIWSPRDDAFRIA